jgi:hypothetical protein
MKAQKFDRDTHQGKTWDEREAYRDFVAAQPDLGGTAIYPTDTKKTAESTFEEEKPYIPKTRKPKKSSNKLLVVIRENPGVTVATIIGTLLVSVFIWIISGYFTMNRELGVHGSQINTLNDDVKNLNSKSDKNEDNYNKLKDDYDVLNTYVSDNIGSVKDKNKKK